MTSDTDNGEIVGNIDLINFLAGFGWGQITREASGRMLEIVRTGNQVVDRLRSKLIA